MQQRFLILLALCATASAAQEPTQCQMKALYAVQAFVSAIDRLEQIGDCDECAYVETADDDDLLFTATIHICEEKPPPSRKRARELIEEGERMLACFDGYRDCRDRHNAARSEKESALIWMREVARDCFGGIPDSEVPQETAIPYTPYATPAGSP